MDLLAKFKIYHGLTCKALNLGLNIHFVPILIVFIQFSHHFRFVFN